MLSGCRSYRGAQSARRHRGGGGNELGGCTLQARTFYGHNTYFWLMRNVKFINSSIFAGNGLGVVNPFRKLSVLVHGSVHPPPHDGG